MNLSWDFQKIIQELEEIKDWKNHTFEQKASKYFALKQYCDMLFKVMIKNKELPERDLIINYTSLFYDYASNHESLTYKLRRIFDLQALQMLENFLKLTKGKSLNDTSVAIETSLISNYQYQLTEEAMIKLGNKFFNTIPFMENNIVWKVIEQNLIHLTKTSKTVSPSPTGIYYPNRHILLTYNDSINLDSLFRMVHEIAHDKDIQKIAGFYQKELSKGNIFSEFFPKLVELLLIDFIIENCDFLALEVNLYKYFLLTNQNRYLQKVLISITNPQKVLNNQTNVLLECLNIKTPLLSSFEASFNEKQYYEQLEQFIKNEMTSISNKTRLKDFINNPLLHIFNLCNFPQKSSIHLADSVLGDGKYLLSTLLAFKFYYLIKKDYEKGMALLKEATEEIFNNYQNPEIVINKYHLEDYLSVDYIQNYAHEYNTEKETIKKALSNKK